MQLTRRMDGCNRPVRVLYSFPHKLGADRICTTAWYQIDGLADMGAEVTAYPGAISRPIHKAVTVCPTLARGRLRIPYRLLGDMRSFSLHDYIVAKRLETLAGKVDIVHTWPLGALKTLSTAKRLGIPTVLERPNAHTRFAYEVVQRECDKLGVKLPRGHEHAYKEHVLVKEEEEYRLATKLLCPSDFVAQTFLDQGFARGKLARHQYGFDNSVYRPAQRHEAASRGLTMLFVGGCAPRKGLHYALDAWFQSDAWRDGKFLIAGAFVPGYAERLGRMLDDPSIRVLGHRRDIAKLMQQSDILTLPSIEEGSALVTSEARGSGCVLLVSEAAGASCQHMVNSLVHRVGDVTSLAEHIRLLNTDRRLLQTLREASLRTVSEITWTAAAARLHQIYKKTIEEFTLTRT